MTTTISDENDEPFKKPKLTISYPKPHEKTPEHYCDEWHNGYLHCICGDEFTNLIDLSTHFALLTSVGARYRRRTATRIRNARGY